MYLIWFCLICIVTRMGGGWTSRWNKLSGGFPMHLCELDRQRGWLVHVPDVGQHRRPCLHRNGLRPGAGTGHGKYVSGEIGSLLHHPSTTSYATGTTLSLYPLPPLYRRWRRWSKKVVHPIHPWRLGYANYRVVHSWFSQTVWGKTNRI